MRYLALILLIPLCAQDRAWVTESNKNAQILLDAQAKLAPEVLAPTENVSSFADIDAGNRAKSCDGAHVQVGAAKSNSASLARRPSPGATR